MVGNPTGCAGLFAPLSRQPNAEELVKTELQRVLSTG
jgi:hypothetical protein